MTNTEEVRAHGTALVAIACGAVLIELGDLRTPRVVAAVRVTADGEVQRLTPVSATLRMQYEVHQNIECVRDDGTIPGRLGSLACGSVQGGTPAA